MKVFITTGLDLGGLYRRNKPFFPLIINTFMKQRESAREHAVLEILVLNSCHRRIMSQSDSASRGADEEDAGG